MSEELLQTSFAQSLALLRLTDAWETALSLNSRAYWQALAGKAMEQMDISMLFSGRVQVQTE